MTLAKKVLLGSAAALVATTGAQAADLGLPVAPAVDYVQICSVAGMTGFILPGSDVCFDIGGFARFEYNQVDEYRNHGANSGATVGSDQDEFNFDASMELSFDARTMTEYGLLRGFILLEGGSSNGNDSGTVGVAKAFIQVGGLVAGLTDSFFDPVYSDYVAAPYGGWGGDDDRVVLGYNYAVGNGVTLGLSLEDANGSAWVGGTSVATAGTYDASTVMPDAVASVRVDQAWGAAAVYGALRYINPAGATHNNDDEIGFAVGASAEFNVPFGSNTKFGIFGTYADGAIGYTGVPAVPNGTTLSDFGLSASGGIATTTAYTVGAGLDIGLNAQWAVEFDGTYSEVDMVGTAGDYDIYSIRGGLTYVPVSGLEIRAGVAYVDVDYHASASGAGTTAEDSDVGGRLRITRSF